jgi:hypothetical protein
MTMTELGRFGDRRLRKGGAWLLAQLVGQRHGSVRLREMGGNRAGELRLWRLLHNVKATPAEMVQTARAGTLARVRGRHVLAIQDTISLRDASNTSKRSLHRHPTIAVDAADGSLLGLADATLLRRSGDKLETRKAAALCRKGKPPVAGCDGPLGRVGAGGGGVRHRDRRPRGRHL